MSTALKRESDRDLFVGNLSVYTSPEQLKLYFQQFGPVEDVRIMFHDDSMKSRRYGFVTFQDDGVVDNILSTGGQHEVQGQILNLNRASKRGQDLKEQKEQIHVEKLNHCQDQDQISFYKDKIFIGGINQNTTKDDLWDHFGQFGKVVEVNFPMENDSVKRNRGFAFITFEKDQNSADEACKDRFQMIRGKRVEVKKAKVLRKEVKTKRKPEVASQGSLLGDHPIQHWFNNAMSNAFYQFLSTPLVTWLPPPILQPSTSSVIPNMTDEKPFSILPQYSNPNPNQNVSIPLAQPFSQFQIQQPTSSTAEHCNMSPSPLTPQSPTGYYKVARFQPYSRPQGQKKGKKGN